MRSINLLLHITVTLVLLATYGSIISNFCNYLQLAIQYVHVNTSLCSKKLDHIYNDNLF